MKQQRTGLQVMLGLIGLIKPLLGVMLLAIFMGSLGHLAAMFITILGGYGMAHIFTATQPTILVAIFSCIALFAISRGILRYAEQASNHYIAFKLLARIRHLIFSKLRILAPAKLDGTDRGNLISIITSDIELLEVFYAHTISPIAIAIVTTLVMVWFTGQIHFMLGIFSLICYLLVGVIIPLLNGRRGREIGQDYRNQFGHLNSYVLDNLYGLEDIIQYQQQATRLHTLENQTASLEQMSWQLKQGEIKERISTDGVILVAGVGMATLSYYLINQGELTPIHALLAILGLMSSFGPTAALSALSNNLHHTLACGDRVLDLLAETPIVADITTGKTTCDTQIQCQNIGFGYEKNTPILSDFYHHFGKNQIHGLLGPSGCGKSTLLKLLMRFYATDSGTICYGDDLVDTIPTTTLRKHISYVTQETFLFQDTIANNIKVANAEATLEQVIAASKKAAIHDLITALPNGYDTVLSELGQDLSGGERQRIGLARAFLHDSPIILLDEPTSNIDSLSEGIILESLQQQKEGKTIVLVSHRKSTMGIADQVLAFPTN